MKIDMIMPQMGESIAEGTIVKWRKNVGDPVDKDEIILEISTDKVDSEIPASAAGTLVEILAEEGDTVEVGVPIARIETAAEEKESGSEDKPEPAQEPAPEKKTPKPQERHAAASSREKSKTFLSPVVKKIAREHGIAFQELDSLQGSGAKGRITKQDMLDYIDEKETAPKAGQPAPAASERPQRPVERPVAAKTLESDEHADVVEMDHVRKRIADHMVMSKQTAPHVTSVAEADLTAIVRYREGVKKQFEEKEGSKLSFTSFFVYAAAQALKEFPLINSSVDKSKIIKKKNIHIGIAVGMDQGLIVPVIRNADQLNLVGLAKRITDLADRARTKKLNPDDVQGGTFSITNIGTFGNLFGTPIINQPQVAILGTGAIKKRPVVVDDMIAIRSMMYISLTYDHRLIDGLYGGSFLQRIVQILENFPGLES